jgi:hypothetical protein
MSGKLAKDVDALKLDDSDDDHLFDTPGRPPPRERTHKDRDGSVSDPTLSRPQGSKYNHDEAREAALQKELESVRGINKVIENVNESLMKAKNNMEVCKIHIHSLD